jgi:hypothetical protein
MTRFGLQFGFDEVREYASRNPGDDTEVIAIGQAASGRGCYTREELFAVCLEVAAKRAVRREKQGERGPPRHPHRPRRCDPRT